MNEEGHTTTDTTFRYTILPPEYNAVSSDIDLYEIDETTGESWHGSLVGSSTRGECGSVLVAGAKMFDVDKKYEAQVVLNRGTDAEIKSKRVEVELSACDISIGFTKTQNTYDDIIKCVAIAEGINPHTIKEVIKAESFFVKDAIVKGDNSTGLMQVIPSTARSLGLTGTDEEIIQKLKDPCTNIEIGSKYLANGVVSIKQSLDNAGITYDDEDLRVYLETYFNLGSGSFRYGIEIVTSNDIQINSWEDFTIGRNELGGISIMRKVVGDKLQTIGKACSGYKANGKPKKSSNLKSRRNKSKTPYDKNNNNVLDEDEWYDWRANKVLIKDRMKKVFEKYKTRRTICPSGSFDCNETNREEKCNM